MYNKEIMPDQAIKRRGSYVMKSSMLMLMKNGISCLLLVFAACKPPAPADSRLPQAVSEIKTASPAQADTLEENASVPPAAVIIGRKQIPVLCYHQIRDWRPTDSKTSKTYIVPPAAFQAQMKMLADSSYHTILPDQLYNYLVSGKPLPPKSIMLTFDDTDLDQYEVALPEMNKHGFKGVFFIMTVSLGRPHYMSKDQVRNLFAQGNSIGSHTWDHHNVKKYEGKDWITQIDKPTRLLESITGKPIRFFAYPFGLWNTAAIPELKKRGFLSAFQLNEKMDRQDPLFTIRRIIVPGSWDGTSLHRWMLRDF